jgi:hypothetical protein
VVVGEEYNESKHSNAGASNVQRVPHRKVIVWGELYTFPMQPQTQVPSPYQNVPVQQQVQPPPAPGGESPPPYKKVDWSTFPQYGSMRKQLKWCKRTLAADRLLWVLPYFYHDQPGICVVDGTDCTNEIVYENYTEEMKELLKTWPVMSDMDSGRSMIGTYCPECTQVLFAAIAIRRLLSQERQKKTMNFWSKLYGRFQKRKHQFWSTVSAKVKSEEEDVAKWEELYAPFITLAKKDKLPVYMVDTNETIVIIKKDILDEKYAVKTEEKEEEKKEGKNA